MLTITSLGKKAQQLLAQSQAASVWGSTSQGLFLHLPPQALLFLSLESYRGPLTANLAGDIHLLQKIEYGDTLLLRAGELFFPRSGVSLDWQNAQAWELPPLPDQAVPREQVFERYKEIYRRVTALRSPSFFPFGLTWDNLLPTLFPLLGQGPGLTPSGDDVILGCLLALSRWGHILSPNLDLQALQQPLISQAYRQTTLLSANLIECAASGQADERLLLALDGIITGQPSTEQCAALLLGWGNSSGCEALVGMGIAINLA